MAKLSCKIAVEAKLTEYTIQNLIVVVKADIEKNTSQTKGGFLTPGNEGA